MGQYAALGRGRAADGAGGAYIAAMSAILNVCRLQVGHQRRAGRLAGPPVIAPIQVGEIPALVASSAACGGLREVALAGAEPTLRPDLLEIVEAAAAATPSGARLLLETDGLALSDAGPCRALRVAGLHALRIPILGARSSMHDWVVGTKGHGRRALRAIRAGTGVGLQVVVDCVLTRPGLPLLAEGELPR